MIKVKKIVTSFFIVLGILIIYSDGSLSAAGLDFIISFDKTEYKKDDPINVEYKLKNNGKTPVYVNKRFFVNSEKSKEEEREIYFKITSPLKKELVFKQDLATGFPKSDYFVLLNPGEEIGAERPRNIKYYFDFNEIGQYEIIGVYKNSCGKEIGLDTYKGKEASKPVTITLIE